MNSKKWIQKALSTCAAVAVIATSSMLTLANSEKAVGELLISGSQHSEESSLVTVNGETAQNGRSIFSSSNIITSAKTGAIIDLGKAGKIELASDTNLALTFDDNKINGNLLAGRVTVLNASNKVNISMIDGSSTELSAGESAATTKAQDDDTSSGGNGALFVFLAVLGGAVAGIVIAATSDNNRTALGGSSSVVSPTR